MSGLRVLITEQNSFYIVDFFSEDVSKEIYNIYQTVINHPLVTILYNTHVTPLEHQNYMIALEYPRAIDLTKKDQFLTRIYEIKSKLSFVATGKKIVYFVFWF